MKTELRKYTTIQNSISEFKDPTKKRIAQYLLDLGSDYIVASKMQNKQISKSDIKEYLLRSCKSDKEELGMSSFFYWFLLKLLISWIVNQLLERTEDA
jgi:hypothetical protein